DYMGAVYGSMLAASVIVGAGVPGGPYPRVELSVLLLCTGLVFWAAHVYAHLFGISLTNGHLTWREFRTVCKDERPIVEAALPPSAAVALGPLFGLDVRGTVWLALGVALCGQIGWTVAGSVRMGAPPRLVAVSALVSLVLGAVIVAAKAALSH
ncbi:hypothetical protein ACFW7J_38065, partial [Streptomyces sp. NPDC059525]|uniref:hypothetical protein n=1 Tax=Streptomyces sp. NPDC059525 TaxID=3346857 RepID=UPI0036C3A40A